MCVNIERIDKVMDDEFVSRMRDVPLKVLCRMTDAIDRVRNKLMRMESE